MEWPSRSIGSRGICWMRGLQLERWGSMCGGACRLCRGSARRRERMPEGDTIYRAARALQRAIGGKVVTGFETGLAKLARVDDDSPLIGRVVEKVESRGKWLLIYFSGDLILVTHMLMSGSWHLYRSGERWQMGRGKRRVVIRVEGWEAVAFNVPIAEFHTARSLERSTEVPKLGPGVLGGGFTGGGG